MPNATPQPAPLPRPARVGRLALLGHPVAHSLSPRFQNAALAAAGLDVSYAALDVAPGDLDGALRALAGEHGAGNVTVPHKEAMARRCDVRSPLAERVGAVNTFWHDADGRLVGDNTDVGGFDAAVRAVCDVTAGQTVALIGAGGSAAAVLAAAEAWPGGRVQVWSRRPDRARALAGREPDLAQACTALADAVRGATLVVNATPLGIHDDDELPVPIQALAAQAAVFDLAYRPRRTAWVRAAQAAGHPAEDGLGMLVEQGALAFERWFGFPPDRSAIWRALAHVTAARDG